MSCYCDFGGGDNYATWLQGGEVTARKAHKCGECTSEIAPGERYLRERGFWVETGFAVHKTCLSCKELRDEWEREGATQPYYEGWTYGQVGCWYSSKLEDVAQQMEAERGLPIGSIGAQP